MPLRAILIQRMLRYADEVLTREPGVSKSMKRK
jgi:hypothetical protein